MRNDIYDGIFVLSLTMMEQANAAGTGGRAVINYLSVHLQI